MKENRNQTKRMYHLNRSGLGFTPCQNKDNSADSENQKVYGCSPQLQKIIG